MRVSTIATAFAIPLCVLAEVAFTNGAYDGITAGSPFTFTWNGDGTPVTINLLSGPINMLAIVDTVASGATGSSYTWTPPLAQDAGSYALEITQSGVTNYSPPFQLTNNIVQFTTSSEAATLSTAITTSFTTVTSTLTPVQSPAVHSTIPSPLYPTGPSNVTALAATSSNGIALPTDGPKTVVLPGNSSAPFVSGAERIGVRGEVFVVGALIVGLLAVNWAF